MIMNTLNLSLIKSYIPEFRGFKDFKSFKTFFLKTFLDKNICPFSFLKKEFQTCFFLVFPKSDHCTFLRLSQHTSCASRM